MFGSTLNIIAFKLRKIGLLLSYKNGCKLYLVLLELVYCLLPLSVATLFGEKIKIKRPFSYG